MLNKQQIMALLPHGSDMCLLDSVIECEKQTLVAKTKSHQRVDNPLRVAGRLQSICCVEYAAQAMAVHFSLQSSTSKPRMGVLAKINQLQLYTEYLEPYTGQLMIKITYMMGSEKALKYQFTASVDQETLVSGQLMLAILEE